MFNGKKMMAKSSVTRKDFSYSKDKVNLNFTLRVDVKDELAAFEELLQSALIDVRKDLARLAEQKSE